MKPNPILIDGRTTLDPSQVLKRGFKYRALGRGQYQDWITLSEKNESYQL